MFSSLTLRNLLALGNLFFVTNGALTPVTDFGSNPTGLTMDIYAPNKLATNPAVILALHYCGGTGQAYYQGTKYAQLADTSGFIVIFPSAPHDNCWDVTSNKTLTHEGGGDSNGLANMLRYTITKYNADPKKLFVTGTSSGGMMTNVMCAVYPDLIAAGSGSSPTTATPTCADGKVNKTPLQWAAVVQAMYPTFNGTYPKVQMWHGTADNFVNYPNLAEEVKEWSGVMDVSWAKNVMDSSQMGYTQMVFGDGSRFTAYSAAGVGHMVPAHGSVDLKWFGIT